MHDTWGISGRTFEMWFVMSAVLLMAAAMTYRSIAFRGRRTSGDHVDAQQAAYLAGGPQLAVYSALGKLRGAGAVGVDRNRALTRTAPLPRDAAPLDWAVYEATASGYTAARLPDHPAVSATLAQIRGSLEQAGLLLSPSQRERARLFVYAELILVAIGLARVAAGVANGRPVKDLLMSFLLVAVFLVFMASLPARTRAGTAVLGDLRRRYAHLAPAQKPAFQTYGPAAAAMGIGLFGLGSLYALDPGFASDTGAPLHLGHSDGGSSCGGGSGDSGGGGCGGGGCGGGCGG